MAHQQSSWLNQEGCEESPHFGGGFFIHMKRLEEAFKAHKKGDIDAAEKGYLVHAE